MNKLVTYIIFNCVSLTSLNNHEIPYFSNYLRISEQNSALLFVVPFLK